MSPPARLHHADERLDAPVQDPDILAQSLDQLAAVNRWLGGTRAVLRPVLAVLRPRGGGSVIDVGTGSGDAPRAIVRAARRERLNVRVTACDLHPQTVHLAAERSRSFPEIDVARADAAALPFPDGAFDVALLSLTLHHFADGVQLTALRELARVARVSIVVNDLERSWPNYLGARLLAATIWRTNPLTRHDGPVSVLRAFTPAELAERARLAGLSGVHVRRAFFYRLVLTARGNAASAAAAHTVA